MAERSVTSLDGVRLAVVERGDPDVPTVVFIHGYPDCKELWEPVMAELGEGLHLIAYDVRGAGGSDAPRRARDYDFDRLGDDLLAVVDEVGAERPVHLVGHDWGGLQGWEFATQARFAERIASFTAICAPQVDQVAASNRELLSHGGVAQVLARGRRSWYILALLTPGLPSLAWRGLSGKRWERLFERREGVRAYPHPTLARDAINGANLYRRNIPRRVARPRSGAVAHVPVQLIVAARDRYIPEDYYERADQHAPILRRHTVDTGHWLPLAEPALVAERVREFVQDVEAGRVDGVGRPE